MNCDFAETKTLGYEVPLKNNNNHYHNHHHHHHHLKLEKFGSVQTIEIIICNSFERLWTVNEVFTLLGPQLSAKRDYATEYP